MGLPPRVRSTTWQFQFTEYVLVAEIIVKALATENSWFLSPIGWSRLAEVIFGFRAFQ